MFFKLNIDIHRYFIPRLERTSKKRVGQIRYESDNYAYLFYRPLTPKSRNLNFIGRDGPTTSGRDYRRVHHFKKILVVAYPPVYSDLLGPAFCGTKTSKMLVNSACTWSLGPCVLQIQITRLPRLINRAIVMLRPVTLISSSGRRTITEKQNGKHRNNGYKDLVST